MAEVDASGGNFGDQLFRAFGASDPLADPKRVTRQGDELKIVYEKRGFLARLFGGDDDLVLLFEADAPDSDVARLVFRAKVRTEGTMNKVKLFVASGRGEQVTFSMPRETEMGRSGEWTGHETSMPFEGARVPSPVKLLLMAEGTGTIFVKDVEILATTTPG